MNVEKAKKTIERLCDTYKLVLTGKKKEVVEAQKARLTTDVSYNDLKHIGITLYNLLLKREYRKVDFTEPTFTVPARAGWVKIPVSQAISLLDEKADSEISVIFYDDTGSKHHYSTRDFDILFYDVGSFSDSWHDVAFLRNKKR